MEELILVEIKPVESYFWWFIVFLCCICNFEQKKKKKSMEIYMKYFSNECFCFTTPFFSMLQPCLSPISP